MLDCTDEQQLSATVEETNQGMYSRGDQQHHDRSKGSTNQDIKPSLERTEQVEEIEEMAIKSENTSYSTAPDSFESVPDNMYPHSGSSAVSNFQTKPEPDCYNNILPVPYYDPSSSTGTGDRHFRTVPTADISPSSGQIEYTPPSQEYRDSDYPDEDQSIEPNHSGSGAEYQPDINQPPSWHPNVYTQRHDPQAQFTSHGGPSQPIAQIFPGHPCSWVYPVYPWGYQTSLMSSAMNTQWFYKPPYLASDERAVTSNYQSNKARQDDQQEIISKNTSEDDSFSDQSPGSVTYNNKSPGSVTLNESPGFVTFNQSPSSVAFSQSPGSATFNQADVNEKPLTPSRMSFRPDPLVLHKAGIPGRVLNQDEHIQDVQSPGLTSTVDDQVVQVVKNNYGGQKQPPTSDAVDQSQIRPLAYWPWCIPNQHLLPPGTGFQLGGGHNLAPTGTGYQLGVGQNPIPSGAGYQQGVGSYAADNQRGMVNNDSRGRNDIRLEMDKVSYMSGGHNEGAMNYAQPMMSAVEFPQQSMTFIDHSTQPIMSSGVVFPQQPIALTDHSAQSTMSPGYPLEPGVLQDMSRSTVMFEENVEGSISNPLQYAAAGGKGKNRKGGKRENDLTPSTASSTSNGKRSRNNGERRNRGRTTYPPAVIQAFMDSFKMNQILTNAERDRLQRLTGFDAVKIKVYFQNRRAEARRMGLLVKSDGH